MKQIEGIWFPKSDEHFKKHVRPNGDYQWDTFEAVMKYITSPKLFFDVGAHVGLWSLMAHRAGFQEIRAFEPNPVTFRCLVLNLMDTHNTHCHNYGIAGRDGLVDIIYEQPNNSGAVKLAPGIQSKVRNINDDNIGESIFELELKPNETLIKIDTEGMEAECVRGMDKIISILKPVIVVEQRSNDDAIKLLKDMGMILVNNIRKDYILIWPPVTSTLSQSTMDAMNSWQK